MLTKNKSHKLSHLYKSLAVVLATTLLSVGVTAQAVSPDNIQIEDDTNYFPPEIKEGLNNGAFDLKRESSTVVSAATEIMLGSTPGIRTVATVNNDVGEVRICSKVSVNYQILDVDGDWDGTQTYMVDAKDENGDPYVITYYRTSDTIHWGFKSADGQKVYSIDSDALETKFISSNKVNLTVPEFIEVDGEKISTLGMSLFYYITPSTMVGSWPNKADVELYVDDLTVGQILEPGTDTSGQASVISPTALLQTLKYGAFDFPGLPDPEAVQNKSFIKVATIGAADPADCAVADNDIQVIIYESSDDVQKYNLIGVNSVNEKTIAENLAVKERVLLTSRQYRAEVKIKDAQGSARSLTRQEYENKEMPFTWNIYYPSDEKCLQKAWNTSDECIIKTEIKSTEANNSKIGAEFNEAGELMYAWFKTQRNNNDALVNSKLENSEQGSFVTVSFGVDK